MQNGCGWITIGLSLSKSKCENATPLFFLPLITKSSRAFIFFLIYLQKCDTMNRTTFLIGGENVTNQKKKLIANIAITAILIIVARVLRLSINNMETVLLPTFLIFLRGVIHLSLVLVWTISVHSRITNKQARRLVLSVGILMLMWIAVKTAKYEFFPNNTDTLVRYLWYLFYIPMLLIPLIGVFVAQYIRKPDDYRLPKWSYLFYIPVLLLLCGILTNDFHNLMFAFPKGIEAFDSDYTYGILYWISMAWYVSLTLAFAILLITKSRLPGVKGVQKIPLIVAIAAVAFWVLYTVGLIKGDLTVIDCIIIATLLETSIQTGLIPTNTSHKELFAKTTVPVIIVDEDYQARYTSGGAMPISEGDMKATAEALVTLGDTVLCSAPITAGRVVWQDDVAELNRQREDLDDVRQQLSEEGDLIQAENEIKIKQAEADEKNRLYDKIAREVKPQLTVLITLIEKAERGENVKENLSRVAVIGSYVKRRGNLLLLGSGNESIPLRELENALRESSENLRLLGADMALTVKGDGNVSIDSVLKAYDLYERVVEATLDTLTAMFIRLTVKEEKLLLSLQIGVREGSEIALAELTADGLSVEVEDNDIYVDFVVGGERT